MSTPAQVGFIARIAAWTTIQAQAAVNTWHYHVDTVGVNPSTDQDISDQFDAMFQVAYKSLISTDVAYRGCVTQFIWPLPISVSVESIANAGACTAGSGTLPLQSSGLISWYTNTAGRHGRGRSYIPFPTPSDNNPATGGHPIAGYISRLAVLANLLQNFHTIAGGGRSATISMCLFDAKPPDLGQFRFVNSAAARGVWATQRRRGAYGRPNLSPI